MPNNESVLDVKPQNIEVLDVKPNNTGDQPISDRLYSLTLKGGMLMPLGAITYPVDQVIQSPYSP